MSIHLHTPHQLQQMRHLTRQAGVLQPINPVPFQGHRLSCPLPANPLDTGQNGPEARFTALNSNRLHVQINVHRPEIPVFDAPGGSSISS